MVAASPWVIKISLNGALEDEKLFLSMQIRKFLHSCLLLEKEGKKLLIDPGIFSFIEQHITPQDIGPVDVILLTHNHADHFDPGILETLLSLRPATILTIPEIGKVLDERGIPYQLIQPGETQTQETFSIHAVRAPHGTLPVPVPDNVGFVVDGLFHPGDSYEPSAVPPCEVLALPVAGPWMNLNQAMSLVESVRPKRIIPIHDAILKDFMRKRIYEGPLKSALVPREIDFSPLELGDTLKI